MNGRVNAFMVYLCTVALQTLYTVRDKVWKRRALFIGDVVRDVFTFVWSSARRVDGRLCTDGQTQTPLLRFLVDSFRSLLNKQSTTNCISGVWAAVQKAKLCISTAHWT